MKKDKRLYLLISVVLLILLAYTVPVVAAGKINVTVNGNLIVLDPQPVLDNGRILVPVRAVSEAVYAKVKWLSEEDKIEIIRGLKTVELYIPSKKNFFNESAIVSGSFKYMDVPPKVVNGRTYVPLRFIAEALGAEVSWDADTSTVRITIVELPELTGQSAVVRDAIYNVAVAKSYNYIMDAQVKIPKYPQLNLMKVSGTKDKDGNYYSKGHILGWPCEVILVGKAVYAKNLLFNDKWVGLSEFGVPEEVINPIFEQRDQSEALIKEEAYFYVTEVVRIIGDPKVTAEEIIGGVLCEKLEFVPSSSSAKALEELDALKQGLENISLTIWVGKADKSAKKIDFNVSIKETDGETGKTETGFVHLIMEFSDLNKDLKVSFPS
jgi:hypothetical protein